MRLLSTLALCLLWLTLVLDFIVGFPLDTPSLSSFDTSTALFIHVHARSRQFVMELFSQGLLHGARQVDGDRSYDCVKQTSQCTNLQLNNRNNVQPDTSRYSNGQVFRTLFSKKLGERPDEVGLPNSCSLEMVAPTQNFNKYGEYIVGNTVYYRAFEKHYQRGKIYVHSRQTEFSINVLTCAVSVENLLEELVDNRQGYRKIYTDFDKVSNTTMVRDRDTLMLLAACSPRRGASIYTLHKDSMMARAGEYFFIHDPVNQLQFSAGQIEYIKFSDPKKKALFLLDVATCKIPVKPDTCTSSVHADELLCEGYYVWYNAGNLAISVEIQNRRRDILHCQAHDKVRVFSRSVIRAERNAKSECVYSGDRFAFTAVTLQANARVSACKIDDYHGFLDV